MNIYKIWQDENNDWDTFDSFVVYAETPEAARNILPEGAAWGAKYSTWASSPDNVHIEYLGMANNDVKPGIILASFNAG